MITGILGLIIRVAARAKHGKYLPQNCIYLSFYLFTRIAVLDPYNVLSLYLGPHWIRTRRITYVIFLVLCVRKINRSICLQLIEENDKSVKKTD